jgi:hypothetical protein
MSHDIYLADLVEEFPELYSHITFECGSGWYPLLRRLSLKIMNHIKKSPDHEHDLRGSGFGVLCVKERHGSLRYSVAGACKYILDLIEDARLKSETTCEECGSIGERYDLEGAEDYVFTLCEDCFMNLERR